MSRTSWPQRDERMRPSSPGRVQVGGFCLLWKMAVTEKRDGAGYLVLKATVSVAKPSYKSSFLIKTSASHILITPNTLFRHALNDSVGLICITLSANVPRGFIRLLSETAFNFIRILLTVS